MRLTTRHNTAHTARHHRTRHGAPYRARRRLLGRRRGAITRPPTAAAAPIRSRQGTARTTAINRAAVSSPPMTGCRIHPATRRRFSLARLALVGQLVVLAVVLTASTALSTVLSAPSPAFADTTHVVALAGSLEEVLTNARNWLVGVLAGLATVFLTVGGVRRVMAGGDPGEHEKAKECFKAAAWGYGLAALAPVVVEALKLIVGEPE